MSWKGGGWAGWSNNNWGENGNWESESPISNDWTAKKQKKDPRKADSDDELKCKECRQWVKKSEGET